MVPWNNDILEKSLQKSINVGFTGYASLLDFKFVV